MTLTEFLWARIAEDEAAAQWVHAIPWDRVLAECEAKRRIVKQDEEAENEINYFTEDAAYGGWRDCHEFVMRTLALPYADHPSYLPEWKP